MNAAAKPSLLLRMMPTVWKIVVGLGLLMVLVHAVHDVISGPIVSRIFAAFRAEAPPKLKKVEPDPRAAVKIKKGAVIFVHGLTGDPSATWTGIDPKTKKDVTWMELCYGDRCYDGYDLFTFGYESKILVDRSKVKDAISTLRSALDDTLKDYYHVVIVAHSLGGIIARSALVESDFRNRPGQVVTFVACATPFKGSELATILEDLTKNVSQHIDLLTTANTLQEVTESMWEQLRRDCGERLALYAAFETLPIVEGTSIVVVRKESAIPTHCDEVKECAANHVDIVKVGERESPIYDWVAKKVAEREKKLITFPSLPASVVVGQDKHYILGPGEVDVKEDIRIPATATLVLSPGTTLRFAEGTIVECQGMIEAGEAASRGVEFDFGDRRGAKEGGILLEGSLTDGSFFHGCTFRGGRGIAINKPNPERHNSINWPRESHREAGKQPIGGAILAIGASGVRFLSCSFEGNRAWTGGAVSMHGSARMRFSNCKFQGNISGAGGGAAFVQDSEVYFRSCRFDANATGNAYAPNTKRSHACGGALYVGIHGVAELQGCNFTRNTADWVGGACYMFDIHRYASQYGSIIADAYFVENRAEGMGDGAGGGALYIDGESRLNLTASTFIANRCKETNISGQSIMDGSQFPGFGSETLAGLVLNGVIEFCEIVPEQKAGVPVAPQTGAEGRLSKHPKTELSDQDHQFDLAIAHRTMVKPRVVPILDDLMANPASHRKRKAPGQINSIVVFPASASLWNDQAFRDKYATKVAEYEKEKAGSDQIRDWERCKRVFECTGVACHYLIDSDGTIHRLVTEEEEAVLGDDANLAGTSSSLLPIAIGFIATPAVADSAKKPLTEIQERALILLLVDLLVKHDLSPGNIDSRLSIVPARPSHSNPEINLAALRGNLEKILSTGQ